MIFSLRSGGKAYEVEVDSLRSMVRIGKHTHSFRRVGNTLFIGEKPVPFELWLDAGGAPRAVLIRGKLVEIESEESAGKGRKPAAGRVVRAPLNGQVVKVSVSDGGRVKEGEVVLTLEAMKMENEIAAPCSGIVKALSIRSGQVVKAGEVLFEMEAEVNDKRGADG